MAGKGKGVFTTRLFNKGDMVCEYVGELITKKEAEKRNSHYKSKKCFLYFFKYDGRNLWYVSSYIRLHLSVCVCACHVRSVEAEIPCGLGM